MKGEHWKWINKIWDPSESTKNKPFLTNCLNGLYNWYDVLFISCSIAQGIRGYLSAEESFYKMFMCDIEK